MARPKWFEEPQEQEEEKKPAVKEQALVEAPKSPLPPPAQKMKVEEKENERREESPKILVTHTDAYVWERMKAQPKTLDEIDLKVEEPERPGVHRLSLTEEFDEYKKKYSFRWIFKSKRAIDEACDIKGWTLANRTLFPNLPNHLFTVNGSIERGDNILGFMPQERAEKIRKRPGEISREKIKSAFERHQENPVYYTPQGEKEEGIVQGI